MNALQKMVKRVANATDIITEGTGKCCFIALHNIIYLEIFDFGSFCLILFSAMLTLLFFENGFFSV